MLILFNLNTISEREISEIYINSLMIDIDELNNDRYSQMEYTEFLELVARLADKIYPEK